MRNLTACLPTGSLAASSAPSGRLRPLAAKDSIGVFFFTLVPSRVQVHYFLRILKNFSMHTKKHPQVGCFWCAMRDLNPHGRPLDPKSSASANSANRAYSLFFKFRYNYLKKKGIRDSSLNKW